jgi:sterol desaturase/sphingolipid hydroxylase (fatty acid hydroxylase superfamily)
MLLTIFIVILLFLQYGKTIIQKKFYLKNKERFVVISLFNAINILIKFFFIALIYFYSSQCSFVDQKNLNINVWILLIMNILALDFISYFHHIISHNLPLLWRIHKVHHIDRDIDALTSLRVHFLDIVGGAFCAIPLIVFAGTPLHALFIYTTLQHIIVTASHSNLKCPRWLSFVIITPCFHRKHHYIIKGSYTFNYGSVFPFWDFIFKTNRIKDRTIKKYGLIEYTDHNSSFLNQFFLRK